MQVEERRVGLAADDDQVQPALVLDVEVAHHLAVRPDDAKVVIRDLACLERVAFVDEPIAVLLDRQTRRGAHLLAVRGLGLECPRLDIDDVPERERGDEDSGEAGEEQRDARHAAS